MTRNAGEDEPGKSGRQIGYGDRAEEGKLEGFFTCLRNRRYYRRAVTITDVEQLASRLEDED